MGVVVNLLHALRGDMRVNLRCGKTAVPQQFLHTPQVCSVVEQMGGETVPQLVRRGLERNARRSQIFLQDVRNGPRGDSGAQFADEKRSIVHHSFLAVALQRLDGVTAEWADPFLPPFANHAQRVMVNIVILYIQFRDFMQTHPCGVECFENGCVPLSCPIGSLLFVGVGEWKREQFFNVLECKHDRKLAFRFG